MSVGLLLPTTAVAPGPGLSWLLVVGVVTVVVGLVGATLVVAVPVARSRGGVGRSLAVLARLSATPRSQRERELQQPFTTRVLEPAMTRVTRLGRRLTRDNQLVRTQQRLDLAGNPPAWPVDRVLSLKVLIALFAGSVVLLACVVLTVHPLRTLALVVVVVAVGWVTPSLIIYQLAYNRSEAILRELPDTLDLLTISVEAGLGFDAAVARVAHSTDGPLAHELARVLQEMQIGTGRADALRALGDRSDVDDLKSFVSAMVQADSYGVPVSGVLRIQAREMRTRRSQRAEEAAQRVPVKILFPLIFGVLPALFVVVIGPGIVQAFDAFRGL